MSTDLKRVILIGHKKRQGKDTLAEMLAEITGGQIIRFADPMKEILSDTFGLQQEELEYAKNRGLRIRHDVRDGGYKQTYREVLQRFGTEAMKKQFGEDVWANLAVENTHDCAADVVIIPDLRFTTVNIVRPGVDHIDGHESETELDGFAYDHVITNDGTLDDLRDISGRLWRVIDEQATV
jgi:hypothetical protein